MTSDIVLRDNNEVHLNGWRIVLNGPDLVIDAGQGRRVNDSGFRRAIVHGPNDTLIINFSNDYPNGVIIQSGMTVNGTLIVEGVDLYKKLLDLEDILEVALNEDLKSIKSLEFLAKQLEAEAQLYINRNPQIFTDDDKKRFFLMPFQKINAMWRTALIDRVTAFNLSSEDLIQEIEAERREIYLAFGLPAPTEVLENVLKNLKTHPNRLLRLAIENIVEKFLKNWLNAM